MRVPNPLVQIPLSIQYTTLLINAYMEGDEDTVEALMDQIGEDDRLRDDESRVLLATARWHLEQLRMKVSG